MGKAKEMLFAQFALIGKALSSPKRLELLELLSQREHSVEALVEKTGLSVANTSRHLQILRDAHLVEARKEGLYVHYRLAHPDVYELFRMLGMLAARQLAEVDRIVELYLSSLDHFDPISRDELMAKAAEGTVVVLDVRPPDEYGSGHISGAISVPIPELERQLSTIPEGKTIVAYCRSQYCILSYEAVSILRRRGRRALRLEGGFPDWKAAGMPVGKGDLE
ncbi:MAG: metalloregulator ArsR/SmtB family transcription factor [Cyanobacteria bacterium NC_groundwater_1444_Ag_S-0.65um_54_12]|nr:metalloregulator ArsR/SmtB family transcription factor [Cyanobacteria bacterium NC_groundwater_1444_Ag_S-0.65um_54_12]